jgi:hypothetical protein
MRDKQQDFFAAIQSGCMLQLMLVVVTAQKMRRTFKGGQRMKQEHLMYTNNYHTQTQK